MKIVNKKKFILYIILYCLGYAFFCLYLGGTEKGNIVLWSIISFFLVLFILWQTTLKDQKLVRMSILFESINILISSLTYAITIGMSDGFSSSFYLAIFVIIFLALLVGGTFLGIYLFLKWDGSLDQLDQYESYSDVMTPEEFARWQEKKKARKERKARKKR